MSSKSPFAGPNVGAADTLRARSVAYLVYGGMHRRGEEEWVWMPGYSNYRAVVRVEVLGRTDFMESEQLELIAQIPAFMRTHGVDPDVYFREPGGKGYSPLESIALFVGGLGVGVAGDLLKETANAAIKGIVAWSCERIRRQPTGDAPPEGQAVQVVLYGPRGEQLKIVEIARDRVRESYTHPSIGHDQ